jgi:hypothetical protein
MIFVKRDLFHATICYEQGKHFRWVVSPANLIIMMMFGVVLAVVQ